MEGKLGASNEPFLNKPARYTDISASNPVRRGNDQRIRDFTIDILLAAKSRKIAENFLVFACFCIRKRPSHDEPRDISIEFAPPVLAAKIVDFLSESCEGETSSLVTGALVSSLSSALNLTWLVKVPPINQCGASSREISDIDVYCGSICLFGIEVKDKPFAKQDIDHALKKIARAGVKSLVFAIGPRGKCSDNSVPFMITNALSQGIQLSFVEIKQMALFLLSLFPLISDSFLANLAKHTISSRAKEASKRLINKIFALD